MASNTLLVVAVLLVTACGDGTDAAVEMADTTHAADFALTAFAVEGEGLRFFVLATGSSRALPFGTDSAVVHDAMLRTAAGGPAESAGGGDCPGSYSRWANGLTLRYTEGRFVGWSVREGDGTVTTASGIGIGSSRPQVEDVVAIRVSSTSIGSEFTAGELAGLFDGPGSDAKVTHLWAGEACIAR